MPKPTIQPHTHSSCPPSHPETPFSSSSLMQSNSAVARPTSQITIRSTFVHQGALSTHSPFFSFTRGPCPLRPLNCPKCYCSQFFLWFGNSFRSCLKERLTGLSFIPESLGFIPQLPPIVQCLFGFRGWTSRLLTAAFNYSYLVPSIAILGKRDHSLTPHPSEMVPCGQGSLSVVLTRVSQESKTVPSTW